MSLSTQDTVQQRREVVGDRLRALRESSKVPLEQAARQIGCDPTRVTRIEGGFVVADPAECAELERLYQTAEPARPSPTDVAPAPGVRWWEDDRYAHITEPYSRALGFEDVAPIMWTYDEYLVPAMLQTREYAYVNQAHRVDVPERVTERNIEVRFRRQQILDRPQPPELVVVLDESILHRIAALGSHVAEGQLAHFNALGSRPNITLQVVPFTSGLNCHAPFTIFGSPESRPAAVVLDQLVRVGLEEDPAVVDQYWVNFQTVREVSLDPADSAALIERMRRSV